jgi:hypothetical protein
MRELVSCGKSGKIKNPKQAIAALSEDKITKNRK